MEVLFHKLCLYVAVYGHVAQNNFIWELSHLAEVKKSWRLTLSSNEEAGENGAFCVSDDQTFITRILFMENQHGKFYHFVLRIAK